MHGVCDALVMLRCCYIYIPTLSNQVMDGYVEQRYAKLNRCIVRAKWIDYTASTVQVRLNVVVGLYTHVSH